MAGERRTRRRGRNRSAEGALPVAPISSVPAPQVGVRRILAQTSALLSKDLLTELRTRETLTTLLFFAVLLVIIFVFSLWSDEKVAQEVGPGIIWISIAFSGTLAIDRSFAHEQEGNTLTALVLIPGLSRSLYFAKTVLNFAYMALVELLVVPLTLVLLGIGIPGDGWVCLVAGLATGSLGFALVGTLFSAMLVAIRRRGVLLPIILYPVTIPILVMGVEASSIVIQNRPLAEGWSWVKVMAAVDILYFLGGTWLFGQVIEDE